MLEETDVVGVEGKAIEFEERTGQLGIDGLPELSVESREEEARSVATSFWRDKLSWLGR